MDRLISLFGTGLVLLALIDIFLTVLYPRSGKGWVSVPLRRGLWCFFCWVAQSSWLKRRSSLSQYVLSYCGPSVLIIVVLVWVLLLLLGFALITWVALGSGIRASKGETPTDFATAFYYSGYILTTLGVGDIVPQTPLYRLLAILEASIGFSIFTLTITYLLAVYSALTQRNIFALSLHHRTGSTANAAELLARIGAGGDFRDARTDIAGMAENLLILLESHHAYPVVHYFRFQEAYYALARMVLLTLDTATLIRSALHKEKYRSLIYSTAVIELADGGRHLLSELSQTFLPKSNSRRKGQSELVLREWYYRAVQRLKLEGIETVSDLEEGAELYIALRQEWEPYVMAIANYMEYDWGEIAPAERKVVRINPTEGLAKRR